MLSVVGGGLLAVGSYLTFDKATGKPIDAVAFPTPLLLVVLAGLVAAAGLGSVLFSRRPFGTALVGLSIAPAATVVTFHARSVLDAVLGDGRGLGSLSTGGLLVTAGTALTALAALVAFPVALSRMAGRQGITMPFLGAVAAAGLLQWWLVRPVGDDPNGIRYLKVDLGGSVWPGVTALCALALVIAAVAIASARCGAATVGTALGAALAVAAELGARFMVSKASLRENFGGELRSTPVILTGATVVVLLLLTIGLGISASRHAAEVAEAETLRKAQEGSTSAWEQSNSTDDPWTSADQSSASGVWGNPESTGAGRSWSSSSASESSSTKWSRSS